MKTITTNFLEEIKKIKNKKKKIKIKTRKIKNMNIYLLIKLLKKNVNHLKIKNNVHQILMKN